MDPTASKAHHEPREPPRRKPGRGAMLLIAVGFCVGGLVTGAATVIAPRARVVQWVERHGGLFETHWFGIPWFDDILPDVLRLCISPVRMIHLGPAEWTRSDMRELGSIKSLEELGLQSCRFDLQDLEELEGLRDLTTLWIKGTTLNDDAIGSLAKIKSLVFLDIEGPITDAGIRSLATLPRLEMVNIASSNLTDAALGTMGRIRGLKLLSLPETKITGEGLGHLLSLPKLEVLHLPNTQVTGESLSPLADMPRLVRVDLSGTNVTDVGVCYLARMKNLQTLLLSDTKITHEGLFYLREATRLRNLVISNTDITDVGLDYLKEVKGLIFLDISGAAVSGEKVGELKAAIPDLQVKQ